MTNEAPDDDAARGLTAGAFSASDDLRLLHGARAVGELMTTRRIWTPEREAVVRHGVDAGRTSAEIAAELGFTESAVETRIQRIGITSANKPARLEQLFRARWATSRSVAEASAPLKLTIPEGRAFAERLGLPPLPDIRREALFRPRGITREQKRWAEANPDHPEAALIRVMAAERVVMVPA